MPAFLEQLAAGRILVADGATGTNLQQAGLAAGARTEDWVFDHPERILDLERAFVKAGADIILTCTFGGTALRMKGSRYAGNVSDLNLRAAGLARQAALVGDGVLVAGSMGPIGQLLKPFGPITHQEAVAAYAEQARALRDGGVDLLVIETQFSLEEADAALEAARSVGELPVVVSFSYDRGTRTMMGVQPLDVATAFGERVPDMIGANCGTTLQNMVSILEAYGIASPGSPLWSKPNAGMPRLEATRTVYDVQPKEMAAFARRAVELGARVVGGCCGSTPEHVRSMADAIKTEGKKSVRDGRSARL